MTQSSSFERALSFGLLAATFVIVALLVEQRLERRTPVRLGDEPRIERVSEWELLRDSAAALLDSSPSSPAVLVFTDFECPFCARLDTVLARLRSQGEGQHARHLVHFPLPSHRYANDAAIAFECARAQGRSREMYEHLLQSQSRIGTHPWWTFARAVGVRDSSAFAQCLADSSMTERVRRGISAGTRLKLSGTPAVLIDGWLIDPATPAVVEEAMSKIVAGKSPTR